VIRSGLRRARTPAWKIRRKAAKKFFPKIEIYAIVFLIGRIRKGRARGKKCGKFGNREKSFSLPLNPLKSLKTAKGIVGKACRIQAKNLEMFGASLERLGGPGPFHVKQTVNVANPPPERAWGTEPAGSA
jgi:hypothetical protein